MWICALIFSLCVPLFFRSALKPFSNSFYLRLISKSASFACPEECAPASYTQCRQRVCVIKNKTKNSVYFMCACMDAAAYDNRMKRVLLGEHHPIISNVYAPRIIKVEKNIFCMYGVAKRTRICKVWIYLYTWNPSGSYTLYIYIYICMYWIVRSIDANLPST